MATTVFCRFLRTGSTLACLALLASGSSTVFAQSAALDPETDIQVELRLALWGLYPPSGDYHADEDASQPNARKPFPIEIKIWHPDSPQTADLRPLTISQPLNYRGPKEILFYRETRLAPDGTTLPIVLARYTPPAGARSLLLLLRPPQAFATKDYRVYGIPFDPQSFPENSIQAYNLSAEPLLVAVGEEKAEISPSERHIFELNPSGGDRPRFLVAKRVQEQLRMLRSTRLRLRDQSRQMIVFTTEPEGSMDIAVFK